MNQSQPCSHERRCCPNSRGNRGPQTGDDQNARNQNKCRDNFAKRAAFALWRREQAPQHRATLFS